MGSPPIRGLGRAMIFQNMVWFEVAAAVVAHDAADVFGNGVQVADEVVDGFRGQVGVVASAAFTLVM